MTPDLRHLRRAVAVSFDAREHGNHPFGAVLVDATGVVALEAENTVTTGHDVTNHAELNLVRLACASIAYADLTRHTLYTSCEPCAMCAGAIYWAASVVWSTPCRRKGCWDSRATTPTTRP